MAGLAIRSGIHWYAMFDHKRFHDSVTNMPVCLPENKQLRIVSTNYQSLFLPFCIYELSII